jgi:acyl carrier protein
MELAELPLTVNGKVDRKGLPAPQRRAGSGYVGARTETERRLVTMWSRVLGIEESVIGVKSNFFELGGNSLKIVGLKKDLDHAFKREIPVTMLFKYFTVAAFAAYLDEEGEASVAENLPARRKEEMDHAKKTMKKMALRTKNQLP